MLSRMLRALSAAPLDCTIGGPAEWARPLSVPPTIVHSPPNAGRPVVRARLSVTNRNLRRLNDALERQAKRIAQSLHDEAGQFVTAACTALAGLSTPSTAARVAEVREHLDRLEEQLRRLAHELRPQVLDDLGLVPALEFLAEGIRLRHGIGVIVHADVRERLHPSVETTAYRVIHEALVNAGRHAHALHVVIRLEQLDEALRCSISDDGAGFDPAAAAVAGGGERFGLIGMREQLLALGGRLDIRSAPRLGTEVRFCIPLQS